MRRFAGRTVTFGIERDADVRARDVVDRGIGGTRARVETPRGDVGIATPLVGRGNLANLLAATAVAVEFDVPLDAIAERAARLKPAMHRGEVVHLARGVTVVDDSYNASPTAVRRALDVLGVGGPARRRVAVLGEMLELGDHAVALHQDVGRAAARAGVDLLITVGGAAAAALAEAAVTEGMPRARVVHFATSDEAAAAAATLVADGDLVLVKGSRGVKTDRVVERLKAELG
jgi:UDP-N-acetylmuramoyl-tripeptide--D-alanyl-D-alanine ligase